MTRQTSRQRGYSGAWEKARAAFLAKHRWCAWCERAGKLRPAVHVHHAEPHKGNPATFWDKSKWVPLCEEHHNRDAQQIETRGYAARIGTDGFPSDPAHPFNKSGAEQPDDANARQRSTSSRGEGLAAIAQTGGRAIVPGDGAVGPALGKGKELVRRRGLCGRAR